MSTFSKNILLCLLLLGIPSAAFARGATEALIGIFSIMFIFLLISFLIIAFFLRKQSGVHRTIRQWLQCLILSIPISIFLFFVGLFFLGYLLSPFIGGMFLLSLFAIISVPISLFISYKITK